jgi:hypothetical protein
MAAAFRDVEAATFATNGSPPITRTTFPTCRAHYLGGSRGCVCRLLPHACSLPKWPEGRHPHCHFRGLLGLHSRYGPPNRSAAPRRPLSRGSSPSGYSAEPLVSHQINRQLSRWILPPQVIRAFGAHGHKPTSRRRRRTDARRHPESTRERLPAAALRSNSSAWCQRCASSGRTKRASRPMRRSWCDGAASTAHRSASAKTARQSRASRRCRRR